MAAVAAVEAGVEDGHSGAVSPDSKGCEGGGGNKGFFAPAAAAAAAAAVAALVPPPPIINIDADNAA